MAWVKSDDREDDRRDIKRAWRANGESIGLRALARTYCARHETDGLVDADWLEDRIEDPARREAVVNALLENDLFVHLPAGEERTVKIMRTTSGKKVTINVKYGPVDVDAYIMADYLDHNDARVEAEARRREQARKKAQARAKKSKRVPGDTDACPEGQIGDSQDCPETQGGLSTLSRPDPTRPDPTLTIDPPHPPRGARSRDREKWRKEMDEWVQANPVTEDLGTAWDELKVEMREKYGQPATAAIDYLHPHRLDNGPVLGCNVGGNPKRVLTDRHGPILCAALGSAPTLIDCQCGLTREQAA